MSNQEKYDWTDARLPRRLHIYTRHTIARTAFPGSSDLPAHTLSLSFALEKSVKSLKRYLRSPRGILNMVNK